MENVIDILEKRGFIDAMTSPELKEHANKPLTLYCGFDPTSNSLHLGNLVAIIALAWFQRTGHNVIAIAGGATGLIGDPSGKSHERPLLTQDTLSHNLSGITENLRSILQNPVILNNLDWFQNFTIIDFLRDVGKHFRLGPMLAKDSVRTRLQSDEGLSFTEFSYQLLQGYDFLYLNEHHNVTLQIGGSDQWGNITAGKDLIRKINGNTCYGLTFPLLTRSDGQKFGKSEKGAIWLSPTKLSPYEFYQYLYRIPDADVTPLMRLLTFMDLEEINTYERSLTSPHTPPHTAQKRLAEEVTRIVHGVAALQDALRITSTAAPGATTTLDLPTLSALAKDLPSFELTPEQVLNVPLPELITSLGLRPSKSEARRLIQNGGVYLNNTRIENADFTPTSSDLIGEKFLLLAVGKKNKIVIQII